MSNSKDSSPQTEPDEDPSPLSNLNELEDGLIEDSDFDLGLQAPESSGHLPSRSPSTPVQAPLLTQAASYANHDFNFDTSDMVLGMSGNHSVASPSLSHRYASMETHGRHGEEELGDIFDFFQNPLPDGADDSNRHELRTPTNGAALLLTQPERSDASEAEEDGYDVDQLLASPLPPSSVDYESGHAASEQSASEETLKPSPPKDSEPTETLNNPIKEDTKQRSSGCKSVQDPLHSSMEPPCCANPQSPAASERGSPQGTKPLAAAEEATEIVPQSPSIALVEGKTNDSVPVTWNRKESKPSGSRKGASCAGDGVSAQPQLSPLSANEFAKVANALSLHTTPNQEMHLPPLVKASSTENLAVPRLERGMGGAGSLSVTLRGALSHGSVAEGLQRNEAAILSRLKELSPVLAATKAFLPRPRVELHLGKAASQARSEEHTSIISPRNSTALNRPPASSEGDMPPSVANRAKGLDDGGTAKVKPANGKSESTRSIRTMERGSILGPDQPSTPIVGDSAPVALAHKDAPMSLGEKNKSSSTADPTCEKANPSGSSVNESADAQKSLAQDQSIPVCLGNGPSIPSRLGVTPDVASECKASSGGPQSVSHAHNERGVSHTVSVHSTGDEAMQSNTTTSETSAPESGPTDSQSVDLADAKTDASPKDDKENSVESNSNKSGVDRRSPAKSKDGDKDKCTPEFAQETTPGSTGRDSMNIVVADEQSPALCENSSAHMGLSDSGSMLPTSDQTNQVDLSKAPGTDESLAVSANSPSKGSVSLGAAPACTTAIIPPSHGSDSSFSSDGSTDTEDDESLCGSEYMERAAAKKRRNEKLWLSVSGLASRTPEQPTKRSRDCATEEKSPGSVEGGQQKRGMLFRRPRSPFVSEEPVQDSGCLHTPCEVDNAIDRLYARYPYRKAQIKLLLSLMGSSIHQAESSLKRPLDSNMIYAPAPIFVTGPSGTGKTAVVRDVVNLLKSVNAPAGESANLSPLIGSAYVNCATIEPTSIDAVVESAFGQLVEDINDLQHRPRKRRKRKHNRKNKKPAEPAKDNTELTEQTVLVPTTTGERQLSDMEEETFAEGACDDGNEGDMEDLVEQERKTNLNGGALNKSSEVPEVRKSLHREAKAIRDDAKLQSAPSAVNKQVDGASRQVEERSSAHAVPLAFGRAISNFFGGDEEVLSSTEQRGCAFLVLDNAEHLLALSPKTKSSERNNFLAQLLLLPQVLGLNLTVIAVTRSNLLEYSRVNNVAPTQKALGTIKDAVRPIRIHFPAYKGKEVFKAILNRPHMKQLIVGISLEKSDEEGSRKLEFQRRVYESFLDILIQSLSSSTRDVRDMIRVGRLWSTYIEPLHPSQVKTTLEPIRARLHCKTSDEENVQEGSLLQLPDRASMLESEALQKEILMVLDQRILPRIRAQLEAGLFTVRSDFSASKSNDNTSLTRKGLTPHSVSYDLPYLSKCLLLAAFICQTNKPDKDQQLFTIQKSGKRSGRKKRGWATDDAEGVAYGATAWERQQQKILRPRSFELERMLSVFVNITGLLQGGSNLLLPEGETSLDGLLRSMGSNCFFESLAQLRDLGLLLEVGNTSMGSGRNASFTPTNLSLIKYWCKLTRDEADDIAKSVDFPLFKFLM